MKKPRNKKYRYKGACPNPLSGIFGGMSGANADKLVTINIINHAALATITQGRGTREEWDRLVGMINLSIIMSERGFGAEFRPVLVAGMDALEACGDRHTRTGRTLLTGDEMRAVNEAMVAHETQLENSRALDVDLAAYEVFKRLKHRNNVRDMREVAA